jgi:hypothetical protein
MNTTREVVLVEMDTFDGGDDQIHIAFDDTQTSLSIQAEKREVVQFRFPYSVKRVTGDVVCYGKYDRYCQTIAVVLPATLTRISSSEFSVQSHRR